MATETLVFETFDQTTPHTTLGPYSDEDYLQLPEGERVELLRGRLIMMSPAPRPRHQFIGVLLWRALNEAAVSIGGIALPAPVDVKLDQYTVLQPDVVYLRPDHVHQIRDRIYGAPDLLVEVLSPSTTRRDRVEKLDLYATARVPEYWIVDPRSQVIEFHVLDGPSYRVTAKASGEYQSPQFAEVELDITAFWQEVDQRLPPSATDGE
ncbi:Uma2 family endonuclease [Aeoliella sp. SH292]|uniref:Uma2 family endonuclease n=1 Tax=Aeoliella sp. SH292 TaxID=3454464 RepID=UPI003F9E1E1D